MYVIKKPKEFAVMEVNDRIQNNTLLDNRNALVLDIIMTDKDKVPCVMYKGKIYELIHQHEACWLCI